ncbi:MAG: hypothetical protein IH586_11105 [Anaerolineaceae bacterium]|nr:hypothetical protein [Anaerolineaceae bacterium]
MMNNGQFLRRLGSIWTIGWVVFWLLLGFTSPAQAGHRSGAAPDLPFSRIVELSPAQDWKELRTRYYAIIYPEEYEILAQMMVVNYGAVLNSEYERFAAVFDYQLSIPVSLRVYSTMEEFKQLNPLTPPISVIGTHSHIGYREISLIGANIMNDPGWGLVAVNHVRYELGVLFVEQITDLKAPAGLLAGIGRYVQDPELGNEIHASVKQVSGTQPRKPWQEVLENADAYVKPVDQVESAAFVSYLVDRYSWSACLHFLKTIATSDGYLPALTGTLQETPESLQNGWAAYYAEYLQSGWQMPVFYQYDLSRYEQMIAAGAYTDAAKGLPGVVDLLQKTGQKVNAETAQGLLDQAQQGQTGGEKAIQARQALLNGDYAQAITLAEEAQAAFRQLGDARRQAELEAYQTRAAEVIGLRGEIKDLGERLLFQADLGLSTPRLIEAGKRLADLGDQEGVDQVNQILARMVTVQEQRKLIVNIILGGVVLGLVGLRVWVGFKKRAPEATL